MVNKESKMKQYLDALAKVMMEGEDVETRNGKVRKLFGHMRQQEK